MAMSYLHTRSAATGTLRRERPRAARASLRRPLRLPIANHIVRALCT
jgi:hypothetical protein